MNSTYLAILFGLISMFAYGIGNVVSKPLTQKYGPGQIIFLRGLGTVVLLGLLALPTYQHLKDWPAALATIGLGIGGYLPVLAFNHAIRDSRLGIVSPIAGSAPLVTVLLAFSFLSITLNGLQWLAILAVIGANILVSINLKSWRQSNIFSLSSGIPYALAAAVGWGLWYFLLVPATRALGPWLAAFLAELGVTIGAAAHVYSQAKQPDIKEVLNPVVIASTVLICLGTITFTVGVRYFNVGIVAALSNSTALVTTVLAAYVFKERLHLKEKLAGAVMIAGVAIISLF